MIPDLSLWQSVSVFVAAAAILIRAAVALAAAADEIAERTRLSRAFVGTLLLAGATSLPEVVTDISAILAGSPDLAVGDLFGSSMANMAILAVLDLVHRGKVWPSVELAHSRVGAMAIALTAFAAISVLTPPSPRLGWIGVDTLALVTAYAAAVVWFQRSPVLARGGGLLRAAPKSASPPAGPQPIGSSVARFVLAAVVVFISAPLVAVSAQTIAEQTGVGETFVGAALLALATSLPELVTSLAALRLGAYDLAVGNLFGSNAANMAVLFIADLAYVEGPLLAAVSAAQAVAAIGAILLMSLALAALITGTESRIHRFEPDAVLLLLVYAGALVATALSG